MKHLSRVSLVAIATATALALSASTAAADEAIEVFDEATGAHCPSVSVTNHDPSGGCHIDVSGNDVERSGHVFGIEAHSLTCHYTFEMRVEEDGTGYLTDMTVAGQEGCDEIRPCDSEAGEAHDGAPTGSKPTGNGTTHAWPFEMEEIDTETYEGHVWVCYVTDDPISECEGELDFIVTEVPGDPEHLFEMETAEGHTTGHAALPEGAGTFSTHCEMTGHYDLETEGGEELHINHLGP